MGWISIDYKTELAMNDSDRQLSILYIDDQIIVVNKLSGLRTIPDGYDRSLPCLKDMLSSKFGRIWTVHRLDKETSGAIIFARNAIAHRALNQQFQTHLVKKEYAAIVLGDPEWDEIEVASPLLKNGDRSHRTIPDEINGKPALTRAKVVQRFIQYTYLTVQIQSGITHQIRAHLSSLGYPIGGDKLYGFKGTNSKNTTVNHNLTEHFYLHAHMLDFKHPVSHENCHIEALLPTYFIQLIKTL